MLTIAVSVVAATAYGASDYVGGLASRSVNALRVVLASYPISAAVIAAAALFVPGRLDAASLAYGAASGVAMAIAVWAFYVAMAEGPMTVVSPLTAVLVAGVPAAIGVAIGERPGGAAAVGIALAMASVCLVAYRPGEPSEADRTNPHHRHFTRRVAAVTVISGASFGVAFFVMHAVAADTGLWPLVAARLAAVVVIVAIAIPSRHFTLPRGYPLRLSLAVAALDVVANVAMLYAFRGGLLSVVAVAIALYPAITVLLAVAFLRERVGRWLALGLVTALASIGLISASG